LGEFDAVLTAGDGVQQRGFLLGPDGGFDNFVDVARQTATVRSGNASSSIRNIVIDVDGVPPFAGTPGCSAVT
jgi:hypothetical protein